MSPLHSRLESCIQAILSLERDIHTGEWGRCFDKEFAMLRDFLRRAPCLKLAESDVAQFENATTAFLAEIGRSQQCCWHGQQHILQ